MEYFSSSNKRNYEKSIKPFLYPIFENSNLRKLLEKRVGFDQSMGRVGFQDFQLGDYGPSEGEINVPLTVMSVL